MKPVTPFADAYRAAGLTEREARALVKRLGLSLTLLPGYARRLAVFTEDLPAFNAAARAAPLGASVPEAARMLGISRQRVYVLLSKGKLQHEADGTVSIASLKTRHKAFSRRT